jgi:hypothetical protein
MRGPDGKIRCVSRRPDLLAPDYMFEDAACSRPLVSCTVGRCEALSVLVTAPDQDDGPAKARLHAVGLPFTGPAFLGFAGRCERAGDAASQGLWQLGREIPWDDMFPLLEEWRGSERMPPPGP